MFSLQLELLIPVHEKTHLIVIGTQTSKQELKYRGS